MADNSEEFLWGLMDGALRSHWRDAEVMRANLPFCKTIDADVTDLVSKISSNNVTIKSLCSFLQEKCGEHAEAVWTLLRSTKGGKLEQHGHKLSTSNPTIR